MDKPLFVLASSSEPRRELLQKAGIIPAICPSNFDESQVQENDPKRLVLELALRKAQAVAAEFKNALVLGCDTVFEFEGEVFGKPKSPKEATQLWKRMRRNSGILYTGHALIDVANNSIERAVDSTTVFFNYVFDHELEAYVATGAPSKYAAGFSIQDSSAFFIAGVDGCISNAIGLSLPVLREMLMSLGYDFRTFISE